MVYFNLNSVYFGLNLVNFDAGLKLTFNFPNKASGTHFVPSS